MLQQVDLTYHGKRCIKLSCKLLQFYACKCKKIFLFKIPCSYEVDENWPQDILKTEQAYLKLNSDVNTHKCRIWAKKILDVIYGISLHPRKLTVWCFMTTSFITGPFYFKERSTTGPVTCTVTATSIELILNSFVISEIQQHYIFGTMIFKPTIHSCMCHTQLFKQYFANKGL